MMRLEVDQSPAATAFPCILHRCLSDIDELAKRDDEMLRLKKIACWHSDGQSFKISDKKKFEKLVMPVWFPRIKYASFVRQLSMFGFVKISAEGAMYHNFFKKGMPELAQNIEKVGKANRKLSLVCTEPQPQSQPRGADSETTETGSNGGSETYYNDAPSDLSSPLTSRTFHPLNEYATMNTNSRDDSFRSNGLVGRRSTPTMASTSFHDAMLPMGRREPENPTDDERQNYSCINSFDATTSMSAPSGSQWEMTEQPAFEGEYQGYTPQQLPAVPFPSNAYRSGHMLPQHDVRQKCSFHTNFQQSAFDSRCMPPAGNSVIPFHCQTQGGYENPCANDDFRTNGLPMQGFGEDEYQGTPTYSSQHLWDASSRYHDASIYP